MFKGYPTGCLLFWETDTPPEIKNKAVDKNKLGLTKVILDGQQRLTTLYMLLRGEIPPYYTKDDILQDPRHLYFNVYTGDFQFYQKIHDGKQPTLHQSRIVLMRTRSIVMILSYCESDEDKDFKSVSKAQFKKI